MTSPFCARVLEALKRRGLTMRQLCRAVDLDPSFFSKVLAGKRSPPMEEDTLRRIAAELEVDAAELIVAAGRIPREWSGLWNDRDLFERMNSLATRLPRRAAAALAPAPAPTPAPRKTTAFTSARPLSEELL